MAHLFRTLRDLMRAAAGQPQPAPAPTVPAMNKIKHLIILTMENRSFDHCLGSLSLPPENRTNVDGLHLPLPTLKDQAGQDVKARMLDGEYDYFDLPHGPGPARADWNAGKNDGFVQQYQRAAAAKKQAIKPDVPLGYYTRETLPILYALADRFTICDRWFSSVLSSTWPNRKYLHGGQRDGDNDTQTLPGYPGFGHTPYYNFLEDQLNHDPDATHRKIRWKCYFSDLPFLAFWYRFAASHARHNFSHIADFVADCREDRLPNVSIVDPPFTVGDDHPPHDPALGQKFIGLVVDALTTSDSWASSALLILYDENGGFYDHVPPPPAFEGAGAVDDPLGFRVPAIIVSPYAKKKHVSKVTFDHTSVMQSVATRWNIDFPDHFGPRWRHAPSIWDDCFDFTQEPQTDIYTGDPNMSPAIKKIHTLNWGAGIYDRLHEDPAQRFEHLLERVFVLPELKVLDRRSQVFDTLTAFEHSVIAQKRAISAP